jgi:hypothetical protein
LHRENYFYHEQNEIGAFDSHDRLKNLKILGIAKPKEHPLPIGIELEGQIFAPILRVRWIYTVEFEDGSDIQIPENYLEKYEAE